MTPPHEAIDADRLEPWLRDHVPGSVPPFTYELIAAGGSNLTFRMIDATGITRVLRRPPVGRGLESAHDMGREFRIMRALSAKSAVPVPECLAICDDPAVTGAPFYLMEFVDGSILRDRASASRLDPHQATAATNALVHTQVALHTLDLDRIGLADLGRHDEYVARQLRRWKRQVDAAAVRDLPLLHELHRRLAATIPPERARPALAHGDYRFDNVVLGADFTVAAVLDWELCTTGDPIADFAWSLGYWADRYDAFTWLPDPPTVLDTFPDRADVIDRYAEQSGFDLSDLPWYEVFSWWKQACIVEGVYARRLAGSTGGMPGSRIEAIGERVDRMLEIAHDLAADVI